MKSTTISRTVLDDLYHKLPPKKTKRNEPLFRYTYFKLGGPADILTIASTVEELKHAVGAARNLNIPFFILGGGSNMLAGDLGFRGLVIKNEARSITRSGNTVVAESGALMNQVASFAIEQGLSGLQLFMSVPGSVGGAVFNNSHFSPQSNDLIGNLVTSAQVLIGADELTVDHNWFQFRYDYSRLHELEGVILSVTFALLPRDKAVLRQQALSTLARRHEHQPVGLACSGCIFRNPPREAAGKLIDESNLKGSSVGGAYVSKKHANFIINDGDASAADVLKLMERVQETVKKRTGVVLKPEIFLVGEFRDPPIPALRTTWRH